MRPLTALLLVSVACGGTPRNPGDGGAGPGMLDGSSSGLAQLIQQYESGGITREAFRKALVDFPGSPRSDALRGAIDEIVLLRARGTAYRIDADLQIGSAGALLVEGGSDVVIGAGVTVSIKGKLYVLGAADAPVSLAGASKAEAYKTLELAGARSEIVGARLRWAQTLVSVTGTADTPILIADSQLDDFSASGVEMVMADGLVIRNNRIGVDTLPENAQCEALHGSQSAVRIEGNVFGRRAGYNDVFDLQPCKAPHNPVIFNNRFLGGDDDAIDLDDCDAIIVSNHLTGFRPGPTAAGMANGGGITGAGGNAVLINNVIEDCVHAIGFKDDARPVILNNTVINNDIGITMYAAAALPAARGIAINNVLWNNKTDVILNGSWYPAYNPTTAGALEASHNVLRDPSFTGSNENLGSDPLLERMDGVPALGAGSPARASGLGDLAGLEGKIPGSLAQLRAWLQKDYRGQPRPVAAGKFVGIDRGAVQNQ